MYLYQGGFHTDRKQGYGGIKMYQNGEGSVGLNKKEKVVDNDNIVEGGGGK